MATVLPTTGAPASRTSEPAVLLYDGACGFCARSVRFVLDREPAERRAVLRFAPLEGTFGAALRAAHPGLARVDSVVWYEPGRDDGRVLVRSDAALAALAHLGGGWRLLATLGRLVPRAIRDGAYAAIARNRHRLAPPTCALPTHEERERFLD